MMRGRSQRTSPSEGEDVIHQGGKRYRRVWRPGGRVTLGGPSRAEPDLREKREVGLQAYTQICSGWLGNTIDFR